MKATPGARSDNGQMAAINLRINGHEYVNQVFCHSCDAISAEFLQGYIVQAIEHYEQSLSVKKEPKPEPELNVVIATYDTGAGDQWRNGGAIIHEQYVRDCEPQSPGLRKNILRLKVSGPIYVGEVRNVQPAAKFLDEIPF